MSKRFAWIGVALAVCTLITVAGCGSEEAPPEAIVTDIPEPTAETTPQPTEETSESQPTTETVQDTGSVYAVTDDSYLGFVGYKPLGQHYGQFSEYGGKIELAGDDVSSAKIHVSIDIDSMKTDDTRLTGTLKNEKWFHVEEYPSATFESTGIEATDDGYTVSGELTIKGTTKQISFPATIGLEDDTLTAEAEFSIDRNHWKLGVGLAEDVIVKDNVTIVLEVEATPPAS